MVCTGFGLTSVTGSAQAAVGALSTYTTGITAGGHPYGIVSGPDGNLWFTENAGNRVGRITPSGVISEFSTGISAGAALTGIALGADGNLWFTENSGNRIGRITPAGVVTEFATGITSGGNPFSIAAGPDGNMWFTESGRTRIGRITPAGVVTEFRTGLSSSAYGITAGPDGNLWFTENSGSRVGKITTAGVITEYSSGITSSSGPTRITSGADGNLWFSETTGNRIGRITTAGVVTQYTIPTSGSRPNAIAAGSDGLIWFAEDSGNKVATVSTTGVFTEYAGAGGSPAYNGMVAGPDGRMWFTETNGDKVVAVLTNVPSAPTLSTLPVSPTNLASASITLTGVLGATFTCSVDNSTFTACTSAWNPYSSPWNLSTTDGVKTVYVKQVTSYGTSAATNTSWTLDRTAPAAPTLSGSPLSPTASSSASFILSGEVGASFTCSVDGGAYSACTSPKALTGLADGAHSFAVKQTDQAGNASAAATASWTVDTTAPAAPVLSGAPAGRTNSTSASISFSGEASASFSCSVDGGAYSACSSPKALSALADGAHSLAVKQTDQAGNTSVAATASWTVDTAAPTAPVLSGAPVGITNSTSATIAFSGEASASFTCSVDGGAYSACSSPKALSALADGAHSLAVKQTDQAGNASVAATVSWTVDTTAPTAPVLSGAPAARTNSTSASISFSGEASASFTCSVDGGAYSACSSPKALTGLADGAHSLAVKQTDQAGNTSVAGTVSWTVDTSVPSAPVLSGAPSAFTNSTSASIAFSGEASASFSCSVDGGSYSDCGDSPVTLSGLTEGEHSVSVKQTDLAGNESEQATVNWAVDTIAPESGDLVPTSPSPSESTTLTWTISFSEPVVDPTPAAFTVGGTSTGWSVDSVNGSGSGPYTVTVSAGPDSFEGTVSLTLTKGTVRDRAGNLGPTKADVVGGDLTFSPPASLMPSRTRMEFGQVPLNSRASKADLGADDQVVKITNVGRRAVGLAASTVSGDFHPVSSSCAAARLAPREACEVTVRFIPTRAGSRAGLVTVGIEDNSGPPLKVELAGDGVTPSLAQPSPDSTEVAPTYNEKMVLAWKSTPAGWWGAAKDLVLKNHSAAPVTVEKISRLAGTFLFDAASCAGRTLGPDESCALRIRPFAERTAPFTGAFGIAWTDASGTWATTANFSDTPGAPPVTSDLASDASYTFNPTPAGSRSPAKDITFENVSDGPVQLGSVTVMEDGFRVLSESCSGVTLAQTGDKCKVTVVAAPSAGGSDQLASRLRIGRVGPDGVDNLDVKLAGTRTPEAAAASPSTVDLGRTAIGHWSPSQRVEITNRSSNPFTVRTALAVGSRFRLTSDACSGKELLPGATCLLGVSGSPTGSDATNSALRVYYGNGVKEKDFFLPINLAVTGTEETLTLSATPDFGSFPVGGFAIVGFGVDRAFRVDNNTGATVNGIVAALRYKRHFVIASNGCSGALPDRTSCEIRIRFAPSAVGRVVDQLTLSYDGPDPSLIRPLEGVGANGAVTKPAFPTAYAGQSSELRRITVTNTLDHDVTVGGPALSPKGSGFVVAQNGCSKSVAPGESCDILLRAFSPALAHSATSLSIAFDAGLIEVPVTAVFKTLVKGLPVADSGAVDFPVTAVRERSAVSTVTVTNRTGKARRFNAPVATAGFVVVATTCGHTSLAPGATCKVQVRAEPKAAGILMGTLLIRTTDTAPYKVTVPLSVIATG